MTPDAPEPAPAAEQSTIDREESLFGAPSDAPAASEEAEATEAPATTEATLDEQLARADQRLALGGRLWLRTWLVLADDLDQGPLVGVIAPNLLDVYADARPTDRVRAYVRGRVAHDWTVGDHYLPLASLALCAGGYDPALVDYTCDLAEVDRTEALLDQAWIKFDLGRVVFVTFGQQQVDWGVGRFWNPTDFLDRQRLDPLAVDDLRPGVGLLRASVPFEAAGANLVLVADFDDLTGVDEIGGAARAEWLVGTTEAAVTGSVKKDRPPRVGFDLSSGVGLFDLRVEAAVVRGTDLPALAGRPDRPREVDRSGEWVPQVVAGLDATLRYNARDAVVIGAEGFYNDAGYAGPELYDALLAVGAWQPFYVGRWYAAAYAVFIDPGGLRDQTFRLVGVTNLSDESGLLRIDHLARVLGELHVDSFVQVHGGGPGELHRGLELDPVPGVPELEDGLSVPPPLVEAGVGLRVPF